jgi:hypothetical protein
MDWTATGASPPICTPPTKTGLVFLLWISELKKILPPKCRKFVNPLPKTLPATPAAEAELLLGQIDGRIHLLDMDIFESGKESLRARVSATPPVVRTISGGPP